MIRINMKDILINKLIDHTLLKAYATEEDIKTLCSDAIKYDFKSVCVNPCFVKLAKSLLKDSNVLVCTVIGFPLGANTIETKAFETMDAVNNGADEIDMVINIGKAKEHNFDYIGKEILAVRDACVGKTLKVIIETCYLDEEEIIECSKVASIALANFVKTSTGFGTAGAKASDVKLMKQSISKDMEVKASGGIRTLDEVLEMVEAGATRIGASSGKNIITEYNERKKK